MAELFEGYDDIRDFDPRYPEYYMDASDEELKDYTAKARDTKIMSIRKWPKPLSEKQRWCLAFWISDNYSKTSKERF